MVEPRYHFKIVKYKYHQRCIGKRYWRHQRVHRLSRGGPGVTVGTLRIGYPCAQDLKDQPRGARLRTRQERALVLPRVPTTPNPLPVPESSGSATCPVAQSTSPARRGLRCRNVPRGTEPVTWQERTPKSPHVSRLQSRPLRRKALASSRD
jgi:hypothetical protein